MIQKVFYGIEKIFYVFYTTRKTCRVCNSSDLAPLFSLGEQYPSDFVSSTEKLDEKYKLPIELELCNNCTLVQTKHTIFPDLLYKDKYWYKSDINQTMRDELSDITRDIESLVELNVSDVVLDIGSNDGTLLRSYRTPGIIRVGVEPAENLGEEGSKGVTYFLNYFWDYKRYKTIVEDKVGKAKVITAIGMLYDLEDPNQFIEDVSKALSSEGIFVIQLMCLRNMINLKDVGNLVHEHLEFYSIKSLSYLLEKQHLEIFDIEKNNVNGESYRIYIRHMNNQGFIREGSTDRILSVIQDEYLLDSPEFYDKWIREVESNKELTRLFIKKLVDAGKRVWIYGASTKGNVILQYYGLDNTLIEGAADRNPDKRGKYTIGTNIPIYSEEKARKINPDYFLVLPYALMPEFIEKEKEWLNQGGKFIIPLPDFRVYTEKKRKPRKKLGPLKSVREKRESPKRGSNGRFIKKK